MLTPNELQTIGDTMHPVIDDLQTWIAEDMARRLGTRLGRGEQQLLTGTDRWQAQLFQEAGGFMDGLQERIARFLSLGRAEIANIFAYAGVRSLAADNRVYAAVGEAALALSPYMAELLASELSRTLGTITNFTRTLATPTQTAFIRVLDAAHARVLTGAQSYSAAVREAVDEISRTQARIFYDSGHSDTIETAVLRAIRTGTAQATGAVTLRGMEERDYDLIRVSAHLGARTGDGGQNPGNHFWWQGGLYSRTGRTAGYPLFVEATGYGTGEGLCGWNCRHSFGPGDPNHNPYTDYDAAENARAYELSQRQRKLERDIRASKRRVMATRAALDAATDATVRADLDIAYTKQALRLQMQNARYNAFCSEHGLKRLDDRIRIANWTRSQAASASAAARRAKTQ